MNCPFCYETCRNRELPCEYYIRPGWYCDRIKGHKGQHVGCSHVRSDGHCIEYTSISDLNEILEFPLT